jgi:hypothetical protein
MSPPPGTVAVPWLRGGCHASPQLGKRPHVITNGDRQIAELEAEIAERKAAMAAAMALLAGPEPKAVR